MTPKYDPEDRFLFWLREKSGVSLDRLYQSRAVRFCMIAIRSFSGTWSSAPR